MFTHLKSLTNNFKKLGGTEKVVGWAVPSVVLVGWAWLSLGKNNMYKVSLKMLLGLGIAAL